MSEFQAFSKIPRLNRDIIITEKIDGTNAQINIELWPNNGLSSPGAGERDEEGALCVFVNGELPAYRVMAGSRNRWITPEKDNFGFARWVYTNGEQLVKLLGEGRHFGEWWGAGVQRGYGLTAKRFSLFNVTGWENLKAEIGGVLVEPVPTLYRGPWFGTMNIADALGCYSAHNGYAPALALQKLAVEGSVVAPGFMNPEGIVVFHEAGGHLFKATIARDEKPKGVR